LGLHQNKVSEQRWKLPIKLKGKPAEWEKIFENNRFFSKILLVSKIFKELIELNTKKQII